MGVALPLMNIITIQENIYYTMKFLNAFEIHYITVSIKKKTYLLYVDIIY